MHRSNVHDVLDVVGIYLMAIDKLIQRKLIFPLCHVIGYRSTNFHTIFYTRVIQPFYRTGIHHTIVITEIHPFRLYFLQTSIFCYRLAHITRLADIFQLWHLLLKFTNYLWRIVLRTVIDQYDLFHTLLHIGGHCLLQ